MPKPKRKKKSGSIYLGEETCDLMIQILVFAVVFEWDAKAMRLLYECFPGTDWAAYCASFTIFVHSENPLGLPWRG